MRENISSNAPWESIVGYSRAVKVGAQVFVSGTTATDDHGTLVAFGDAYAQTQQVLRNIEKALDRAGAKMEHVVRTRIYVKDISQWKEIARAHSEAFDWIRPATAMVEVARFIDDDILVEIEADAVIS